jgi:phosphoglucosamine mutase
MKPLKRKYFGTDGIRGRVGEFPITAEFFLKLGFAVGKVLGKESSGKVIIGKDTRISGYMFESALEAGLSAAGMDIQLLGPMPTPAIAYLTRTHRAKAGIVISASHNPYADNGIKFFSSEGLKLPDEIELAIEEELEKPLVTVSSDKLGRASRIEDAPGRYIEFCKSTIPNTVSLSGMKIVADCANGASYHIAPHVFSELGAEVIELSVDPDGFNINQNCGSTNPTPIQRMVVATNADVGIALDGDGDRVLMVDHLGNVLDGDDILYIIARYYSQKNKLSGGVVGTIMSNMGLEQALQKLGLSFVRANVGDRYVISELQKQGWLLGGEPSGHIVWLRSTTTGDGIVSALQVLSAMRELKKTLSELKQDLHKYPQVIKNVSISNGCDPLASPILQKALKESEIILQQKGRIILRPSGTEPVLRIMVESEDIDLVHKIANKLAEIASLL